MAGNPQLGTSIAIGIDCTQFNVVDPAGVASNLIIQTTDSFKVSTQFELGGMFASWIVGMNVPYTITYFYEGMGGAADGTLGTVPRTTNAGQLIYGTADTEYTVPPSTLLAGLYKLTVVVSFGGAPPMTAFYEGPMIQVF
ncbi:MAG: hypothetical protein ACKVX9_20080 [Blastocatellia bacterium]